MRSGRDWRFDVKWLLILLIVDFMLVFQILPLSYLLFRAFTPQGSFSLSTFGRLFNYEMNRSALVNTVVGGLSATVLGTLIAFPLAWLVGRTNLHGRKFFRRMFVLTYMVPPYVGAMAWLRLLNPNVGSINIALRGLFGLSGATGPINVYSLAGLVWVLTTFYYPYAFITISRAMEKMDPSLEEASRVAGASPFVTLARVTLPIMTPSLIAGALLVFVSAASCYGIPSIIGAPGKVHTVTTRIIEYYGRGTQGLNDATGLAIFLMVLAILILYLSDVVIAKKQYITVSGKSTRPNIVDLRAWRVPLTILVSLFAGLIVVLPFTTILTTSLKIDVGKSVLDAGNFTLNQWSTIFTRSETMDSLKNSLIFASVAATVGITVAITMSYLLQRTRIRGRRLPDFLITLGSGSPSVVIALGLIMSMQGRFGVNIYNTAYIIIVAYLIKYMMMGMRTVTSAISQIHVSLEESSQVAGASWLGTMRRVTGPLIFPSIAAGWFLIFIPCFYELSMTTLLYSNTTKTIGFQLYEYWTYTSQPQASAMAFGILLIVILINTVLNRLTKGEFSI
ncbi:MAG: iron ABC transporter permease [Clostridiales bacterium]|nr:iron ABC transporter permease [Clostridiales bacterium]